MKSSDGSRIDNVLDLSQITTCDPGRVKKFALDEKLGIEKIESKAFEGGLSFRAWYERPWNGSFKGYEGVVRGTCREWQTVHRRRIRRFVIGSCRTFVRYGAFECREYVVGFGEITCRL